MKYSIKVNEVRAKEGSNIKGFATVVFGDSFKITNIAILENKDKGQDYHHKGDQELFHRTGHRLWKLLA